MSDELNKQIEQLSAQNAELTAKVQELEKDPSKKELADAKKRIKELEQDNLELAEQISVAEKNTEKAGLRIVQNSKGEKFKLGCAKFKFEGAEVSFEELKENKKIVDALLAKSSGLLTPLN